MASNNDLIIENIANGIYSLSPKRKGKSFIWTVVAEIFKEDGTLLEGLVYCRTCRKLLKFPRSQTSNLIRHKCCKAVKELKTVGATDKQLAIDTCAEWIIEDCRPFSSVSGLGFVKLAKFFIKMGAVYGENVDVDNLLPDPTAIYRKVQKAADEKRKACSSEIKEIVKSGQASVTIDMWSDNNIQRNFLGATLHFHKNFKMYNVILGLKSMHFTKSTGPNILIKLKTLFQQFGVEDIDNIIFVTDRRANIVKAFQNKTRVNCSSQLLANVLDKSFEETYELTETLEECKKIVKYFKKANLQYKLTIPTSLKNACRTRWHTNYTMFKSIVNNWNEVNTILSETEETKRLVHINITMLTVLVELCKDFEFIFKTFQDCSSSSLCYVLPSIDKIKTLCVPKDTDVPAILSLKANITNNIDNIWVPNLSIWHKVALFLFPPAISEQAKDLSIIKDFCISQISNFENDASFCSSQAKFSPANGLSNSSNPTSKVKSSTKSITENSFQKHTVPSNSSSTSTNTDHRFFFSELFKKSESTLKESVSDEVERYRREVVTVNENFDPIEWWQRNEKYYPRLCNFAMKVHSIPASSAASERPFSLASNLVTEKRNSLGPKSLDSLLFLNSYVKNLSKTEDVSNEDV